MVHAASPKLQDQLFLGWLARDIIHYYITTRTFRLGLGGHRGGQDEHHPQHPHHDCLLYHFITPLSVLHWLTFLLFNTHALHFLLLPNISGYNWR